LALLGAVASLHGDAMLAAERYPKRRSPQRRKSA